MICTTELKIYSQKGVFHPKGQKENPIINSTAIVPEAICSLNLTNKKGALNNI